MACKTGDRFALDSFNFNFKTFCEKLATYQLLNYHVSIVPFMYRTCGKLGQRYLKTDLSSTLFW